MAENLPYEKFFKDLVELDKKQREIRKNQGINDYNILTSVLSEYDEVRLHSRMIASFLDSQGYHYQDSLFFDLFMETLELADFGIDSTNLEVTPEYNDIDIYITDGARHIIIENKIGASDEEAQIQKYVAQIYKENKKLEGKNLLVLYLSIDRASPSQTSLGNLTIQPDARRDKLVKGDKFKAYFKNINYVANILPWLERCQKEMKDIPNLNMAFDQYAQVVRNITNTNERTKMTLAEILKTEKAYYDIGIELANEIENFGKNEALDFIQKIEKELRRLRKWECKVEESNYGGDNKGNFLLIIKKRDDDNIQAVLTLAIDKTYWSAKYGIAIIDPKTNPHKAIELEQYKNILEKYMKQKTAKYWITSEIYPKGSQTPDFIKYILFKEDAVSDFVETIKNYLDDHKDLIEEINALIKPRHK